ncbi:Molybdopterin-converting factor subunit, putative [Perkinsus marinus ATCC 50983]|uniref:Molybdopterin-converting factor subunit, putative n=1 Tax=Perkinsus marinus (strain ATCC 50983 / TXsc) TaxID=423536 RepID=C5LQ54_PERM5|nr:Molybdopterin-converting factor subunit, putative [Perkinsus marinus ATCC 50983]EER01162.1 Molybdopterin-converting factor subunit, putative [Perkinsus marinus ATCC 50983]|eukprot:XP_002768444.1 Molybdopterin-converting factor subunit, putative [Perkinsus marinus ATCC 50983]
MSRQLSPCISSTHDNNLITVDDLLPTLTFLGEQVNELRDEIQRRNALIMALLKLLTDKHTSDVSLSSGESPLTCDNLFGLFSDLGDVNAAVEFVTRASGGRAGGISTFVGVTRQDKGSDGAVEYLVYEAHEGMARKKMLQIITTLADQYPVLSVYACHRLGRVNVGEASIIITAASAHRKAAIEFVSAAIDALKGEVPVWKKEVYLPSGLVADGATAPTLLDSDGRVGGSC